MQSYTLSATSYVVDGGFASGFSEGALPSPDLTWYTTNQTDIGFDFASLSNRLYGSFDYFFYKTFGYLMAPTGQSYLNQVMGISMPKVKSESEFRREGIEIQLGWRDNVGDFSYDIAADYELLIRYLRTAKLNARYLNESLVRMRLGGKSTRGWRSNLKLNQEIVRGNRENGYFCCLPMLVPKYAFKVFEFILPRLGIGRR